MATTVKRITLALSKETLREIEELQGFFGETQSDVIRRAVWSMYHDFRVSGVMQTSPPLE